jgi:hypothetical protein
MFDRCEDAIDELEAKEEQQVRWIKSSDGNEVHLLIDAVSKHACVGGLD